MDRQSRGVPGWYLKLTVGPACLLAGSATFARKDRLSSRSTYLSPWSPVDFEALEKGLNFRKRENKDWQFLESVGWLVALLRLRQTVSGEQRREGFLIKTATFLNVFALQNARQNTNQASLKSWLDNDIGKIVTILTPLTIWIYFLSLFQLTPLPVCSFFLSKPNGC